MCAVDHQTAHSEVEPVAFQQRDGPAGLELELGVGVEGDSPVDCFTRTPCGADDDLDAVQRNDNFGLAGAELLGGSVGLGR